MLPSAERRVRAILPLIRVLQVGMPLRLSKRLLANSMALARLRNGVTLEEFHADGVHCAWIRPPECQPRRVLLYLHGGGFVYGVTPQHLQMCSVLAQRMRAAVLFVDYRLAPEHPYPAALEDCVAVYRWLLDHGYSAGSIAIAGDSAGGNLTLASMLCLRDSGDPLPAAAACLSPVTDMTIHRQDHAFKDPLLPPKAMAMYSKAYLAEHDPASPLISPALADLRALPPLLVHAGEDELLREDAARIVERARAAGVDAHLEIYPRMWHVWQIFSSLPQSGHSLDAIARFLSARFDAGGQDGDGYGAETVRYEKW